MDYALICEVERRVNGQAVHAMAQVLTRYSSSHQLIRDGETRFLGMAQQAEKELRQFLFVERMKHLASLQ